MVVDQIETANPKKPDLILPFRRSEDGIISARKWMSTYCEELKLGVSRADCCFGFVPEEFVRTICYWNMELNFQQRWEFIRDNGSDSSSSDSKCSSRRERAFTNVTSIGSTVLGEDDKSTDAGRFQKKNVKEPSGSGKSSPKKRRERRKGKESQAARKEKMEGKSGRTSVGKATSLNSLENYTNSLVEDLKVARQNLVTWMKEQVQEIIGEETANGSISREKLLQNTDVFDQAQAQHQNYLLKPQHHINTRNCIQVQHRTCFVSKNFQDAGQQVLNQSNLLPDPKLQNISGENKKIGQRKRTARSSKSILARSDQADNSLAIVPATTSEKLREKYSSSPAKPKLKPGPPKHQQKKIVLGIRAQTCNDIFSARASRGKRTAISRSSLEKRNLHQWQASSSILPTEKHQNGIPSLSSEPNFSVYSTSYVASVLQSQPLPLVSTRPLNAAANATIPTSFSSFDPTLSPNQLSLISTTQFTKLLGSSDGNRYFQTVQPQENTRAFSQTWLKESSFSNQKTATPPAGERNYHAQHYLPSHGNVPSRNQPGLDSLLRQSNNMSMPSLMMDGVAGFSGQNYSLSEQYINSSFPSFPAPNADGRLMASQGGFQFQK